VAQMGTLAGLYERSNVPSVSIKDEVFAGRLLASSKFSVVITVIICVPWNSFLFCDPRDLFLLGSYES
jgi:hypothetical protein